MAVKAMIRTRLLATPTFTIPDARLFNAGAIQSTPDLTQGKFAVLRFDPVLPGIGPLNRAQFFLYVYDRLGSDYAAITAALKAARDALVATNPTNHGDGHINQIKWQGTSGELVDDTWRATTRFDTFEVVYSGT